MSKNQLWLVTCCLSSLAVQATGCRIEQDDQDALAPVVTMSPTQEEVTGLFTQMDAHGCSIAIADPSSKMIHLYEGTKRTNSFGSDGDGPGELRHPRALAIHNDSVVTVLDATRRRRIDFTFEGRVVSDLPVENGPAFHSQFGPIVGLGGGHILDYPLGSAIGATFIDDAMLDTMSLVQELDGDGQVVQAWGHLRVPGNRESARMLRVLLQTGSMALRDSGLYVLNHLTGQVWLFDIRIPSRHPTRTILVQSLFDPESPQEEESFIDDEGFIRVGKVVAEEVVGGIAVDYAGRIYVLTYGKTNKKLRKGEGPWPNEMMIVYDSTGLELGRWHLPTRNTRAIRLLSDGRIVTLSHPSDQDDETWHVLIYRRLFEDAGNRSSCIDGATEHG